MRIAITLLLSLGLLNASAQSGNAKDTITWKTLKREQYTIQYPAAWRLDTSGAQGADMFAFSPILENDKFSENVNVYFQSSTEAMVFDQVAEASLNDIKATVPGVEIIDNKHVKSGNTEYQSTLVRFKYGEFTLKTQQYLFVKDKTLFTITFSSEDAQYEKYKPIMDKIFKSFQISR